MFKYFLLVAIAWAMPCGMATASESASEMVEAQTPPITSSYDFMKESIDAARALATPMAANGEPVPSDLLLDSNFSFDGMFEFWPPSASGFTSVEQGLRVFPHTTCTGSLPFIFCSVTGYYVVGRQQATDARWRAWITRVNLSGRVDTTFGDDGWMYPALPWPATEINDAAISSGGSKIYTVSTQTLGPTPSVRVTCTDLTTGDSCLPVGKGVMLFGINSTSDATEAWGRRIIYDDRYGLLVAARVKTPKGWELGVARMNVTSGMVNTDFFTNGYRIMSPITNLATGNNVDALAMAVTPSSSTGNPILYIGGTFKYNAFDVNDPTDYDGFVLGLVPATGNKWNVWDWLRVTYDDDNSHSKKDAVTAITVLRNGKLAVAGWSETDKTNERLLMLARFKPGGLRDYSFCGGHAICTPIASRLFGVRANVLPGAIAERAGSRDLVVAVKNISATRNGGSYQSVYQFGAGGKTLHAQRNMMFGAYTDVTPYSEVSDLWMGATGSFGGLESIVVVGRRTYMTGDHDATISRLVANDSIFADQFGGHGSD